MTKSYSEVKLEKARKELSNALRDLEETTKRKMIGVGENDALNNESTIMEQSVTIKNLSHEINNLQQNLLDLGDEMEFLKETNFTLTEKLSNIKQQQSQAIQAIELDLLDIEKIITNEE